MMTENFLIHTDYLLFLLPFTCLFLCKYFLIRMVISLFWYLYQTCTPWWLSWRYIYNQIDIYDSVTLQVYTLLLHIIHVYQQWVTTLKNKVLSFLISNIASCNNFFFHSFLHLYLWQERGGHLYVSAPILCILLCGYLKTLLYVTIWGGLLPELCVPIDTLYFLQYSKIYFRVVYTST